ncbi:MAG TPA: hypothetical protein VHT75_10080 [Acidimicrobiales bacterium]|nr:hypothetical protein [Acidimicrobiales bacterium]
MRNGQRLGRIPERQQELVPARIPEGHLGLDARDEEDPKARRLVDGPTEQ